MAVDKLEFEVGGDDADYERMTKKVIAETEDMARRVETRTTQMTQKVAANAAQAAAHARTIATLGTGGGPATSGGMPKSLADMFPEEMGRMQGSLDRMKAPKAAAGPSIGGVLAGGALEAFGLTGAGEATILIEALGVSFTTTALAAGTFTAALVGTTYAISGLEGVMNIIPNLAELGKISLYFLSAGFVDLTAKTAAFREGEKETQAIMESGQARVNEVITARTERIRGLANEIKRLKDHSVEAQNAFIDSLRGQLGQQGISGEKMDVVASRAAETFERERVHELIEAQKRLAATYGMTRAELLEYKLEMAGATEAEKEAARAIEAKMAKIDAEKKAKQEAEAEARKKQHEAEAEERRRQSEIQAREKQNQGEAERIRQNNLTDIEKKNEALKKAQGLFRSGHLSPKDYEREINRIQNGDFKEKNFEGGLAGIEAGSGAAADLANKERLEKLQLALRGQHGGDDKKADQENKALYAQMVAELKAVNANLAKGQVVQAANVKR